jgi:hypothetical protein
MFGSRAIDSRPITAPYARASNIHFGNAGGAAWASGVAPFIERALASQSPTVPPPPPPKDKVTLLPLPLKLAIGAVIVGVGILAWRSSRINSRR